MLGTIPSDLEQFVQQQVATGQYHSQEEVVVAGLQILREVKSRQAALREDIQVGIDQLDRGEGIELSQDELRAFFDDIQARGRQRYEASRKAP